MNVGMPLSHIGRAIAAAKLMLVEAVVSWLKARGLAVAFLASAARLERTVRDAITCVTDVGRVLDLTLDPPAVVRLEIEESVRRWRWRNIAARHASLQLIGGVGPDLKPIWKLLNSKFRSGSWGAAQRGAPHPILANRQWPQERCFRVGFVVDHMNCLLCFHFYPHDAPVGTLRHRHWVCQCTEPLRIKEALQVMVQRAMQTQDLVGEEFALDRGFLSPISQIFPPPHQSLTPFTWEFEPANGVVSGTIYTDGSQLGGPTPLLRQCGWAFAALDAHGTITASAYGVPPEWVDNIGGAEAWAMHAASSRAVPKSAFRVESDHVLT